MPKPNAKSNMKEMKDYIRSKRLNKPEVRLTMRKAEMVAGLKKIGHWDTKHDGATKKALAKQEEERKKKQWEEALAKHNKEEEEKKKHIAWQNEEDFMGWLKKQPTDEKGYYDPKPVPAKKKLAPAKKKLAPKPLPKPTMVGGILGDKKSMDAMVEKLKNPAMKSLMSQLETARKIDTFANAKKARAKGKVHFIKWLAAGNKRSKDINNLIDPINKMYKNDKITETEYKKIGQPLKRYQNVRRKIVKLIQTSFDNQQDFMKAEKEAGVNLKDFR